MQATCPCFLGNKACLGSRAPCHGDVRQVLWGLPLPGLWHWLSVGCGLEGNMIRGPLINRAHEGENHFFLLFCHPWPPRFLHLNSPSLCLYPSPQQGWSDKHFPGSVIRLGNMGHIMLSSPGAQLRLTYPCTNLHCWPGELLSAVSTEPCHSAQSREPQYTRNAKTRQDGKALKQRPSANFHLLCHLASFSAGHTESIFVGLDFC